MAILTKFQILSGVRSLGLPMNGSTSAGKNPFGAMSFAFPSRSHPLQNVAHFVGRHLAKNYLDAVPGPILDSKPGTDNLAFRVRLSLNSNSLFKNSADTFCK